MEGNLLLAIFVLLAATVLLVPLAKWAGLGTILGYLVAGVLIGPYGLQLVSDSEMVHNVAEFGVVMMLFLIGLEVDADEFWRMRHQVIGLGLTQMVATSVILSVAFNLVGFSWAASIVVGMALAMSSTAIAMQSVAQRNITKTDTGRASLSVLLVQDVAVIPILAAVPLLAGMSGAAPVEALGEEVLEAVDNPFDWWVALGLVGAFVLALAGSRWVIRPFLMPWIARAKVPEAFTAFALALVIGAALVAESFHLSPALGAFLGGVLLADSEYRHELESNLEPFKGLLLGLFFISVGMSIAFNVVIENPLMVIALVVALIAVKMAVLFLLATFFRMHLAERLLLAVLLSQAGEFAFVVLQFARTAGNLSSPEVELLTVVVALSMAITPLLLFLYDRLWAPRLNSTTAPVDKPPGPEGVDGRGKVLVLGYGRFGQIVTRLLRAQGFEMTLIDDDPAQIELVKRFGVQVFYGDGGRLDILRSAGIEETKMVVIAVAGGDRILSIAAQIRRHYPDVIIAARAVDRSHAHDLMALGVQVIERETFRSALRLGEQALVALGQSESAAARVAGAFQQHDERMLRDSYAVRHDRDAYIGFVRRSTEMLDAVMKADRESVLDAEAELEDELHEAQQRAAANLPPHSAGDAPEGDIDNAGKRASE
jgi:glutathione-regulated potassium-efflux system ancillary protein KefC